MEIVGVVVNAVVIAVAGIALAWHGNGRFEALGHRIDQVEAAINGLRSDIVQVALAVGARSPKVENG